MRSDNATFAGRNLAPVKRPYYTVALSFDTANTDITYLTSHQAAETPSGATVIRSVIAGVSGTSQKIDPINARSTIGNIDIRVTDKDEAITDRVRTKLDGGDGLRGKRVVVYMGYKGLDWDDYVTVQTQVVEEITVSGGEYVIKCSDIQRESRQDIFDLAETNITATVSATATTINVGDTTDFSTVFHGASYSDAPSSTVGYIKIGDEVIRYTGKTGTSFTGCTRGVLNTKAVEHTVDANASDDRQPKVEEYVYLELPAVKLAYAILTGTLYDDAASLPDSWNLGISTDYVSTAHFTGIGTDLWDTTDDTKGRKVRFLGLKKQDGKKFLEEEIYRLLGLFSPVLNDGQLALKRQTAILADAAHVVELNEDNVVSHGDLVHDMKALHNRFVISWNYDEEEEEFTRTDVLIDSASIATHGTAKPLELEFRGLDGFTHTQATLAQQKDSARDRYTGPPLRISVTCLPSLNRLEVGDIVRLVLPNVRDFTNDTTGIDRSFEVQQVAIDWITGEVRLDLFGSSQRAALISATSAATVLTDGFYTSAGTELSTVLTMSGGAVTASGTLTGNADMNASGAIYYYDGDLTINDGVTITITGNVQLRVKGELTCNGSINGKGQGLSAGTGGNGAAGTAGGFGTTKAGDGSLVTRARVGNAIASFERVPVEPLAGDFSVVPYIIADWDGTTLEGIPSDLRGTSGGAGEDVILNGSIVATGGDGGDGGAGLCIICRGMNFGVNGAIDTSGNDGAKGGRYSISVDYMDAGSGAGGAPGGVLILLDGASVNEPSNNLFTANLGNSPDATGRTIRNRNPIGRREFSGYQSRSQKESAWRTQLLAEDLTAEADVSRETSKATAISTSITTNLPQTPAENLCTVDVQVTAPSDGNYSHSNVYYKTSAQTAYTLAGPADDERSIVLAMDGTTYNIRARPVSIFGVESDDFVATSITVPNAKGQVVLASGNRISTGQLGSELITNGAFASDTGWTKGAGWSIGSGVATRALSSPQAASNLSQGPSLTVGLVYQVTFTITAYTSGTITPYVGTSGAGTARSAKGTYTELITCAGSPANYFALQASAGFAGSVDNVVVKLALGIEITADGGIKALASDGSTKFEMDPTDGVIKAISFITESGSGKRIEINPSGDNEIHFYGDRGDGTVEELATVGIRTSGGDNFIGYFGGTGSGHSRIGVGAFSNSTTALYAQSDSGIAVFGLSADNDGGNFTSTNGYGVVCQGANKAPLYLVPGGASAPTHAAAVGSLWVTSAGVLYINTSGSTTWAKVGAQ